MTRRSTRAFARVTFKASMLPWVLYVLTSLVTGCGEGASRTWATGSWQVSVVGHAESLRLATELEIDKIEQTVLVAARGEDPLLHFGAGSLFRQQWERVLEWRSMREGERSAWIEARIPVIELVVSDDRSAALHYVVLGSDIVSRYRWGTLDATSIELVLDGEEPITENLIRATRIVLRAAVQEERARLEVDGSTIAELRRK